MIIHHLIRQLENYHPEAQSSQKNHQLVLRAVVKTAMKNRDGNEKPPSFASTEGFSLSIKNRYC